MNRATDLCTCGKPRDEHGDFFDATQHTFFPNPQPTTAPQLPFNRKLHNFLALQGNVRYIGVGLSSENGFTVLIEELDGKVWEVQAFLRKDPAASQEGV